LTYYDVANGLGILFNKDCPVGDDPNVPAALNKVPIAADLPCCLAYCPCILDIAASLAFDACCI
jgi:hypothetical protein